MLFTLVIVYKIEQDKTITGSWLQDHIGTLESAIQWAIDTEAVNGNKLDIAVVANTMGCAPYKCIRLDKQRCTSK